MRLNFKTTKYNIQWRDVQFIYLDGKGSWLESSRSKFELSNRAPGLTTYILLVGALPRKLAWKRMYGGNDLGLYRVYVPVPIHGKAFPFP